MANKAAAGSAMSLGLDNVTIALFVPVDNNDVIAKLSGEPQKIEAFCRITERKMSNRLTESVNKRTQGHAFVSDQKIADLAQRAGSQDKDGFHTLWKAQKEEFLAKADQKIRGGFCLSTDDVVILTHKAEAGDADAFWTLGKAYQRRFTKKIEKMIYYYGIPVDAHDIYASALGKLWERCLKGSFKPTQSFYRFLRTTIYHNFLDYLKKNRKETPESLMAAHKDEKYGTERSILEQAAEPCQDKVTLCLEMFQLLCECCAKPHQIIGIGFVKLLEWKPREVVAKLSDETLDILAKRFLEAYYSHFMVVPTKQCRFKKSVTYEVLGP